MKKTLLALVFALVAQVGVFAQNYNFVTTTGTYTDLVSPTVVSGTALWDDSIFTVPLGFNFSIGSNVYTSVDIDSNGGLFFSNASADQGIVSTHADLLDRGTTTSASPISYLVTGTTPNRIFKVQWKNAGFYDGVTSDFMNMQVWVYETSSKIEIHYGTSSLASPMNVYTPFTGPITGILTDFTSALSGIFLQGNPASPTAVTVTNATMPPYLNAISPNGTIYTFTVSGTTGVAKELNNTTVSVYPNPASDILTIQGLTATKTPVSVKVFDTLGKVVLYQTLNATNTVNIESLNKGTYFMEISNGESRIGKNIIKL